MIGYRDEKIVILLMLVPKKARMIQVVQVSLGVGVARFFFILVALPIVDFGRIKTFCKACRKSTASTLSKGDFVVPSFDPTTANINNQTETTTSV